MALLGGSPLGLIGVNSSADRNGMSTFNGGKSRNINVVSYNSGTAKTSLFTGNANFNPYPKTDTYGTEKSNNTKPSRNVNRSRLHNNEIYDTSILNIVEKLSGSSSQSLRLQDFAYLRDIGVYPNNRLMIARRFLGPVGDDLNGVKGAPKSVLISWKPEGEDFLDF